MSSLNCITRHESRFHAVLHVIFPFTSFDQRVIYKKKNKKDRDSLLKLWYLVNDKNRDNRRETCCIHTLVLNLIIGFKCDSCREIYDPVSRAVILIYDNEGKRNGFTLVSFRRKLYLKNCERRDTNMTFNPWRNEAIICRNKIKSINDKLKL